MYEQPKGNFPRLVVITINLTPSAQGINVEVKPNIFGVRLKVEMILKILW